MWGLFSAGLAGCFDPSVAGGHGTRADTSTTDAETGTPADDATTSSDTVADESTSSTTQTEPPRCRLDEAQLDNCLLE
jgi:hypothetical protein